MYATAPGHVQQPRPQWNQQPGAYPQQRNPYPQQQYGHPGYPRNQPPAVAAPYPTSTNPMSFPMPSPCESLKLYYYNELICFVF